MPIFEFYLCVQQWLNYIVSDFRRFCQSIDFYKYENISNCYKFLNIFPNRTKVNEKTDNFTRFENRKKHK